MGGRVRFVVVLAAVLVTAPVAGAAPAFKGNVCGLLTAKQVAAIPGVTSSCKNAAPLPALGGKQYEGDWAGVSPKSPTLQVTIGAYSDPGALQLAVHNLKQGFSGGTPKKVAGIVTRIEPDGVVTVRFEDGTEKRLMLEYAGLEKV